MEPRPEHVMTLYEFILAFSAIVAPLVSLALQRTASAKAAKKVDEVKVDLATAENRRAEIYQDLQNTADTTKNIVTEAEAKKEAIFQDLQEKAASTHSLVNGKLTHQLQLYAKLAARLADVTGDSGDREIAEAAAKLAEECAQVDLTLHDKKKK